MVASSLLQAASSIYLLTMIWEEIPQISFILASDILSEPFQGQKSHWDSDDYRNPLCSIDLRLKLQGSRPPMLHFPVLILKYACVKGLQGRKT